MRPFVFGCLALSAGLLAVCKSSSPSASSSASASASAQGAPPGEAPAIPGLALLEGFEGEIDAQFATGKAGQPPAAIAALLKSGKLRFDVPEKLTANEGQRFFGPKAWGIFDSAAKKLSIVSDVKKQVVVIDLNTTGERFKNMSRHRPPGPGGKTDEPDKIAKTGKVETVAGRTCEDWDISGDRREATVCVAHEGISWFSLPAAALPSEHAWALELMDGKHFPMKFVGYDKDGTTENSHFEITKMEKKSVPDSTFEYPADYNVMDLDQLFQSLAGMRSGVGVDPAANGGGTMRGAGGTAAGRPTPGMPSSIPGLTPEQMQQIRQRMQQTH